VSNARADEQGLATVNPIFTWVRLAQRVPVRIRIDHVPDGVRLVGVEALGAEMIGKQSYYERWIVAFANILFRKGLLTPTEFASKMKEVEARWPAA
jgi:hypothetical protein